MIKRFELDLGMQIYALLDTSGPFDSLNIVDADDEESFLLTEKAMFELLKVLKEWETTRCSETVEIINRQEIHHEVPNL